MNSSRRQFFNQVLGAVGLLAAGPALLKSLMSEQAQAQTAGAPSYVVPGQGMAASVGYVENKTKVEKSLMIERNGVAFKDQKCSNCVLFQPEAGGKGGKCALFPNQLVKPTSWCKSWSKKPA